MRKNMVPRNVKLTAVMALLVGSVFLAGCYDNVTVDRDPSILIQRGMNWAWRPAPAVQSKDRVISRDVIPSERTVDTQVLRDQLKIAIEQTLASKGLVRVNDPAQADFLVDYRVGIQRRRATVATPAYPPVVCGYYGCWQSWGWDDWGGWGYWGPPAVMYRTVRYREGTLIFDLVKRNTNRLAFRAISRSVVTGERFRQGEINGAVRHLLKDLKPHK
jgi:Domain of unknown function (DUF4136)